MGLPGAPAGGHGELLFPTVDAAGRSVGVGWRNRPCVAGIGIVSAGGHPALDGSPTRLAANGPHIAGRPGRARRRSHHRETTPPWFLPRWPRSRACCFQPWIRARPGDAAELPRRPSASPHDRRSRNRPEQGRDYRDRCPDRRRLRMGHSRSPVGAAKAVLSPSSPPPERPRPHSLRGAPGSRGGCALVV